MIFIIIPFFLIELYLSLKVGETIGFFWSVVWIVLSFMLGVALLKRSSLSMLGNMHAVRQGKLDMHTFQNASMSYLVGSILVLVPGVFSDFLGLLALAYTLYLQFVAKITPEHANNNFKPEGEDNVIDVEIIDEYTHSDRNT